jgi:hypothetical protein
MNMIMNSMASNDKKQGAKPVQNLTQADLDNVAKFTQNAILDNLNVIQLLFHFHSFNLADLEALSKEELINIVLFGTDLSTRVFSLSHRAVVEGNKIVKIVCRNSDEFRKVINTKTKEGHGLPIGILLDYLGKGSGNAINKLIDDKVIEINPNLSELFVNKVYMMLEHFRGLICDDNGNAKPEYINIATTIKKIGEVIFPLNVIELKKQNND